MDKEDIEKVCNALKISPQTLRLGLKEGKFPFGTCVGEASYTLYPAKVKEFLGVNISVRKKK